MKLDKTTAFLYTLFVIVVGAAFTMIGVAYGQNNAPTKTPQGVCYNILGNDADVVYQAVYSNGVVMCPNGGKFVQTTPLLP